MKKSPNLGFTQEFLKASGCIQRGGKGYGGKGSVSMNTIAAFLVPLLLTPNKYIKEETGVLQDGGSYKLV